jgi:hypothetical protein
MWPRGTGAGAQSEEAEKYPVALFGEFLDRARSHFGFDAVDELLPQFGCQLRRAEGLPPGGNRPGELVQEVRHAAFAAPQVVEQNLPHDAPAQSRPPAQCRIDIGDAEDTLADEVVNLAHHGRLQAIGNVAG